MAPLAFVPFKGYLFTMSSAKTQSSLFDAPRPGSNMPEFSVSEISKLLKKTVEETFGQVRVKGEIGSLKVAPSGHIYFDLKDQDALLASVCWKGQAAKLGLKLEMGMEVVCTGRLTTYMQRSNYQLVVEQVSLAGMGALLKMLEERKKKLAAEGLFDPARKQLLPYLPEVIGVVTSPTGAVIRDILHRLADRFPRHVLIWPVLVQGAGAAEQIAAAIEGFNALPERGERGQRAQSEPVLGGSVPRPDVLIVARGGGSIEDLMPFNEEIVVRAAAASDIPLISAVGHETDTTLIDFAADVRAPTPTAAAEMAVPVREDLLEQVNETGSRLRQAMRRAVENRRERLTLLSRALGDPARAIEPIMQRLDERAERLMLAWQNYRDRRRARVAEAAGKIRHPRDIVQLAAQRLQNLDHRMQSSWREGFLRRSNRFEALARALQHLSPMAVLGRGYALVQSAEGHVVTSAKQAKSGAKVSIRFQDGQRDAVIED
jgi:exodeoxyribonuclease VII large subunit